MPGPNRLAAEQTLAVVSGPAAVVQLVRSLADAVDAEPTNASLWREYRAAIADLTKREPVEQADPGAELLRRLAALGDTADTGATHDRPKARKGGGGDGDAVHALAADGGGRRRRVRRGYRDPDLS